MPLFSCMIMSSTMLASLLWAVVRSADYPARITDYPSIIRKVRFADDTHGTVLAVANRAGSKDRSDLNGYTFIRSKHCTTRSLLTVCLEQTSDGYRIHLQETCD